MLVLVTGGAGFIGSHLADAFLAAGHDVRVVDDLSGGFLENVPPEAEVIHGDIADEDVARKAVDGVEQVFHHAAHRSVPKSVADPLATDRANTHGTVALLKAAVDAGVQRFVYASSSSVYGGAAPIPTPESAPVFPRSPYAVSKLAAEQYCRVFADLYSLETISLRYFNVFGPRQRPDSAYAAVIPRFIDALQRGERPVIYGDGSQSRAFSYVDDVVAANLLISSSNGGLYQGQAYNIAGPRSWTLLELLVELGRILGVEPDPVFADPRPGDIKHSGADLSAAARDLSFQPMVDFDDGLRKTVEWFTRDS